MICHFGRGIIGRLFLAFFLSIMASGPALAQHPADLPPSRHHVDGNGIDVITGKPMLQRQVLSIGPAGPGGLTLSFDPGRAGFMASGGQLLRAGMNHNYTIMASVTDLFPGTSTERAVVIGSTSDFFDLVNGWSSKGTGAMLETAPDDPDELVYTAADGTRYRFDASKASAITTNGQYIDPHFAPAVEIRFPTGEIHTLTYRSAAVRDLFCRPLQQGCGTMPVNRLQSVTSNTGYQLIFTYESDQESAGIVTNLNAWLAPKSVVPINNTEIYCTPEANGCNGRLAGRPAVTFALDGQNRQRFNLIEPDGATWSYDYNGLLSGVTRPGNTTPDPRFTYGRDSRIATVTIGSSRWTYTYRTLTVSGRELLETTVTDPLNRKRIYTSDPIWGELLSVRDELNRTVRYEYAGGKVTRITYPEGNQVRFTYQGNNLTETRRIAKRPGSPADIVTTLAYPDDDTNPLTRNKPAHSIDAKGHRTDYTYDPAHGQLLSVTGPAPAAGQPRPRTEYGFTPLQARILDVNGTPLMAPGPVYRLTSTTRCATQTVCAGSVNEVKTSILYGDPASVGNLLPLSVTVGSGDGSVAQSAVTEYDRMGNVAMVDGPLPGAVDRRVYRYDDVRRVVAVIEADPDGDGPQRHPAQRLTWRADGALTRMEEGHVGGTALSDWPGFVAEQRVDRAYDDLGRPQWEALLADGGIQVMTQFGYDAVGRLECVAQRLNPALFASLPASACDVGTAGPDGPNRVSRSYYDAAGQVIRVVSGLGTPAQREMRTNYTANGRAATLVDGRGLQTVYEYDGFDRVSRVRYMDPLNAGLISTTDVESFAYDPSGRVTQSRARDGAVTLYGYDDLGRPVAVDRPEGLSDVTMAYDLLGRTLSVTDGGGSGVSYGYDALDRVVAETRLVSGSPVGTVVSAYDGAGRRTGLTHGDGFGLTYDWRADGSLISVAEAGVTAGPGVLTTYGYDAQGRLDRVDRGNGVVTRYDYDGSNRLLSLGHDAAGAGGDVALGFTYGAAGEILSRALDNSAYAAPLPDAGDVTGVADALNRLTSVGGVAVSHDSAGRVETDGTSHYLHDTAGRLIAVTPLAGGESIGLSYDVLGRLSRVAPASGTGAINLVYDGLDVVAELDDAGTVLRRYVHGAGADNVLASYDGAGTGNRRWLLTDERGSVIAGTDGSGAVSGINAYDEYGVPAPSNSGLFQYTGQVRIPGTGLYHYKARAYHPGLGRFLQPDPMGYADGPNLYAYVGNDPVNLVDPLGLQSCPQPPGGAASCSGGGGEATIDPLIDNGLDYRPGVEMRDPGLRQIMDPYAVGLAEEPLQSTLIEEIVVTGSVVVPALRVLLPRSQIYLGVGSFTSAGRVVGADALGAAPNLITLGKKFGIEASSAAGANVLLNLNTPVRIFISQNRKTSILRVFPGEHLNKTVGQALRDGGSDVRKLLLDGRFAK